MPPDIIGTLCTKLFHLFIMSMFSRFFNPCSLRCDNYINSTCADSIHVDAITGTASVLYKDGSIYRYENVSRRAIIKFIMDPARSLGQVCQCCAQATAC